MPQPIREQEAANHAFSCSRKDFLQLTGRTLALGVAGSLLAPYSGAWAQQKANGKKVLPAAQQGSPRPKPYSPPATIPAAPDRPIKLEAWKSDADQQEAPLPAPLPEEDRIGYAVVGLGHLSLGEILPAFGQSKKAKLVALVSGSPEKMQKVARQYSVRPEHCYSYEQYDELQHNPEVQAIYIVLPNALHAEYTIRGAKAGKHILCEKPMATSAADCKAMIAACREARVKLMVAYRIQYEPYNRQLRKLVQEEQFGKAKFLDALNGQASANPKHWRHVKALAGGGALPDIGLYCLNTARFVLGTEPTEVFAWQYSTPGNPLFREVEELVSWQMKFPGSVIVNCATDYNVHESRYYRVLGERGWLHMDSAFAYQGQQLKTSQADGKLVRKEDIMLMSRNQFATELDHFAGCILDGRDPYTPGEEGLQDQRIMEAIYQSAREGVPVQLKHYEGKDRFRGPEPEDA